MIDYISFIVSLFSVFLISILFIKYILNPIFFPNYFPKYEVLNYLTARNLCFKSYKKIEKRNFNRDLLDTKGSFFYRNSYFQVEVEDTEKNNLKIKVKQSKSNSLFHKNKIEFFFEK